MNTYQSTRKLLLKTSILWVVLLGTSLTTNAATTIQVILANDSFADHNIDNYPQFRWNVSMQGISRESRENKDNSIVTNSSAENKTLNRDAQKTIDTAFESLNRWY